VELPNYELKLNPLRILDLKGSSKSGVDVGEKFLIVDACVNRSFTKWIPTCQL